MVLNVLDENFAWARRGKHDSPAGRRTKRAASRSSADSVQQFPVAPYATTTISASMAAPQIDVVCVAASSQATTAALIVASVSLHHLAVEATTTTDVHVDGYARSTSLQVAVNKASVHGPAINPGLEDTTNAVNHPRPALITVCGRPAAAGALPSAAVCVGICEYVEDVGNQARRSTAADTSDGTRVSVDVASAVVNVDMAALITLVQFATPATALMHRPMPHSLTQHVRTMVVQFTVGDLRCALDATAAIVHQGRGDTQPIKPALCLFVLRVSELTGTGRRSMAGPAPHGGGSWLFPEQRHSGNIVAGVVTLVLVESQTARVESVVSDPIRLAAFVASSGKNTLVDDFRAEASVEMWVTLPWPDGSACAAIRATCH